tara:strand:- start:5395 stop:6375 length:981 start_codon:yes stop_codon:yes gene_type:complete
MDYTFLGRTGLKVSRLCLGTMNFGSSTSEKISFEIMDRAIDHGINFFDTANVYGNFGGTEKIIGKWFTKGGSRREKIVLATKVYGGSADGWYGWPKDWPNTSKLSAKHIITACDESLRRLQTEYIDLYQMHHIDRNTPWEEIWQAMEILVAQGKVLYVGSSNFAGWHIAQANENSKKRNFLGLVSEQSLYNLSQRSVELEVLPCCEEYGVGFIPWSPLAGGMLGGLPSKNEKSRRKASADRYEKFNDQLEKYFSVCDKYSIEPAQLSLAWLLHNPLVTAPIVGPRTVEQLDESIISVDFKMEERLMNVLDKIWPGPGGPAPEAYSW